LCHLDYQPSHVVLKDTKYYIMDWIHAKLGNPVLDIAQTYTIIRMQSYDLAHKYLYKIMEMTDYQKDEIYKIVPLMAAIKMIETDDIFEHKVLTTLVYDPKNKDVTK
jgi:thiamine kinase-like enzyme